MQVSPNHLLVRFRYCIQVETKVCFTDDVKVYLQIHNESAWEQSNAC